MFKRKAFPFKIICSLVIALFAGSNVSYAAGPSVYNLPAPNSMITVSPNYTPLLIKGLKVYPEEPFKFDFIVDTGNSKAEGKEFESEARQAVKYFLAALTTPDDELWVNLSPYEQGRIVPEQFGQTSMGRDLLAQDYILKQLMSSLTYPEGKAGKEFWSKVYTKAQKELGTTNLPIDTYNKIWIIPDKAVVYQDGNSVFITDSYLKVMMEKDYLASGLNTQAEAAKQAPDTGNISSSAAKDVILPIIEKEVNYGKNFAKLRQIYHSLILALWYKDNLTQTLLSSEYVNKNKIKGVDISDKNIKEKIYNQYVSAYKKGVYDYIKKDYNPDNQRAVRRRYFSGGFQGRPKGFEIAKEDVLASPVKTPTGEFRKLSTQSSPISNSAYAGGTELREESLANLLHVLSDETKSTPEGDIIRTINLDDLFTLVSTYSKEEGTTSHEFSGYSITPIMMIKAKAGDETERDWKKTLVELEDGVDDQGRPYRDGILPGNSYNQRMSSQRVGVKIRQYEEAGQKRKKAHSGELAQVRAYYTNLRKKINIAAAEEIESNGEVSFGAAIIEEDSKKKIIFESGFTDMIKAKGNPHQMLTRVLVYLSNGGTHEENRIAEYEYYKTIDPKISTKLRVNVEKIYDRAIKKNVDPNGDPMMIREIERKVKESLWEIGVHMLNGDMQPQRVRWSENDPAFTPQDTDTGDVTAGLYISALHSLHLGQFEPVLRAIAQFKMPEGGCTPHAFDYRKQGKGMNPTFFERLEMLKEWIDIFDGLLVYAKVLEGSEADGETKFKKLVEINGGRKGKTTLIYTAVGGDHMHIWAPSKNKDEQGYRIPKMDGDHPQPDTVTKIDNMNKELADFMKTNNIKTVLAFNFRELFESLPMPIEVEAMKKFIETGFISPLGHINLFGTSSTNIRAHYSGNKDVDITHLPLMTQNYIKNNGRYRGWMIGLPFAIKRIANNQAKREDADLFFNWFTDEVKQGRTPTAAQMAKDFTFREEDLRKFKFTAGSLEAAEAETGVSFRGDLIEITEKEAQKLLTALEEATSSSIVAGNNFGGVDITSARRKIQVIKGNNGVSSPAVLKDNSRRMKIDGLFTVITGDRLVEDLSDFFKNPGN